MKKQHRKAKHRNDYNHGKNGRVAGNDRYNRKRRKPHPKDKSMGKN